MFKETIYSTAVLIFTLLLMAGCGQSSKGTNGTDAAGEKSLSAEIIETLKEDPQRLKDYMASLGLVFIREKEINGDTGYLYEYPDKKDKNEITKKCLILTGTPYSMGFQSSFLRPGLPEPIETRTGQDRFNKGAYEMLSVYIKKVGLSQFSSFGLNVPYGTPEGEEAWEALFELMDIYGEFAKAYIPAYMQEEMQGIVDGLHAYADTQGPEYSVFKDIRFKHVLTLNQGVDSTYFLIASLLNKAPKDEDGDNQFGDTTSHQLAVNLFIKIIGISMGLSDGEAAEQFSAMEFDRDKIMENFRAGCNEWAVTGNATKTGESYHGRDFMFSTAGIYQDASCVMVYLPSDTDGDPLTEDYPFVTTETPGFVGHASGLNTEGISVGTDVSQAGAYGKDPGVGCLLICRDILQKTGNLTEAIETARKNIRGVPWIYIVADDHEDEISKAYGGSVVLECGRSDSMDNGNEFRGYETLNILRQWRFAYAISKLPESDIPIDGITVRSAKWQYPSGLSHLLTIDPDSWGDHPEFQTDLLPHFPRQTETYDDVVIATNHFITPEMRFTQLYLPVQLLYGLGPMQESMWRYDFAGKIIDETYGNIEFWIDENGDDRPDYGSAAWLIDYLNPNWENAEGEKINSWFYCSENPTDDELKNEQVHGHHAAFNNSTGEMRALFGYMQDPWVEMNINLMADALRD